MLLALMVPVMALASNTGKFVIEIVPTIALACNTVRLLACIDP
jgi:hypothetical protein